MPLQVITNLCPHLVVGNAFFLPKKLDFGFDLLAILVVFQSWELASALKEAKPKFNTAAVKLVAIGVGTPNKAWILADRVCFFLFSCYLNVFSALAW